MPPVSSTMQALSVAPLGALLLELELEDEPPAGGVELEELGEGEALLPHAASASAATTAHEAASPVCSGRNTMILSIPGRCVIARRYSSKASGDTPGRADPAKLHMIVAPNRGSSAVQRPTATGSPPPSAYSGRQTHR